MTRLGMDARAKALSVEMEARISDSGPMHFCQCRLLSSTILLHVIGPGSYPDYLILSADEKQTKVRWKG